MKLHTLIWAMLATTATMTTGCKTVQTTFVNTTSEPMELQVHGPGRGVGLVGTIPGDGQIRTAIKVSPVWLPTTYTFVATTATNQRYSGAFSLANDSNAKIKIMIPQEEKAHDPDWRHAEQTRKTGSPTPIVYEP